MHSVIQLYFDKALRTKCRSAHCIDARQSLGATDILEEVTRV